MPIDAAEGGISLAEEYLAATLAGCARFRTWVGAATEAEALRRVYFTGWPLPADGDRYTPQEIDAILPCALIFTGEASGFRTRRVGFAATQQSGALTVQLQEAVPAELARHFDAAERRFKNTLGKIIEQMHDLFYTAGYLAGDEVLQLGPWRCDPDDEVGIGDTQMSELAITWGQNG